MPRRLLRVCAIAMLLACGLAASACTHKAQDSQSAENMQEHAQARAKSLFEQCVSGKLDRSDFTPEMDKAFSPELLKQVQPQFATLGPLKQLTLDHAEDMPQRNGTDYVFNASFSGSDHRIEIFLMHSGLVGGFHILP